MDAKKDRTFNEISKYLPYIIFTIVITAFHIICYAVFEDDARVIEQLPSSLWDIVLHPIATTCSGWSSRILINPPIWIFCAIDYRIWMIMDILVWLYIYWIIGKLCVKEMTTEKSYVLMLLLLLFPIDASMSVGCIVTSMTYIWPAAAALTACVSIRNMLDGKKTGILKSILFILLLLYAANKEELSVMLTMVFFFAVIRLVIDRKSNKKTDWLIVIQFIVSFGSVLFHMLSSGNRDRAVTENIASTTGLAGLLDKLDMTIFAQYQRLLFDFDFLFISMCLILFTLICLVTKGIVPKLVAALPLIVFVLSVCADGYVIKLFFDVSDNYMPMFAGYYISEGKYGMATAWIQLAIYIVITLSICFSIIKLSGKNKRTLLMLGILVAGFCGRLVVCFGGHGWQRYSRTYTFFYFGIILVTYIIVNLQLGKLSIRRKDILLTVLIMTAMFSQAFAYVNMIGYLSENGYW